MHLKKSCQYRIWHNQVHQLIPTASSLLSWTSGYPRPSHPWSQGRSVRYHHCHSIRSQCEQPYKPPVNFHWITIQFSIHVFTWQARVISYINSEFYTKWILQSWPIKLYRTFSNWNTYRITYINAWFLLKNILSQWRYPNITLSTPIWLATRKTYLTSCFCNRFLLYQWRSLMITISDPILHFNCGAYLRSTIYTN